MWHAPLGSSAGWQVRTIMDHFGVRRCGAARKSRRKPVLPAGAARCRGIRGHGIVRLHPVGAYGESRQAKGPWFWKRRGRALLVNGRWWRPRQLGQLTTATSAVCTTAWRILRDSDEARMPQDVFMKGDAALPGLTKRRLRRGCCDRAQRGGRPGRRGIAWRRCLSSDEEAFGSFDVPDPPAG
jgi:hypothetical protein